MISLSSINLVIGSRITIFNSNGSVAGHLESGNYVAEFNEGQQTGWYSIYSADTTFQKGDLKLANVFLWIGADGRVFLRA